MMLRELDLQELTGEVLTIYVEKIDNTSIH